MNTKPAAQPLLGEDGELLSSDTTADPNAYADYVATFVRRDPLWFRAREHIKDYWLAYLVGVPSVFLIGYLIVDMIRTSLENSFDGEVVRIIFILLAIVLLLRWINYRMLKL